MDYYYIFVVSMFGFIAGSITLRFLKNLNAEAVINISAVELMRLRRIEKAARFYVECSAGQTSYGYMNLSDSLSGGDES